MKIFLLALAAIILGLLIMAFNKSKAKKTRVAILITFAVASLTTLSLAMPHMTNIMPDNLALAAEQVSATDSNNLPEVTNNADAAAVNKDSKDGQGNTVPSPSVGTNGNLTTSSHKTISEFWTELRKHSEKTQNDILRVMAEMFGRDIEADLKHTINKNGKEGKQPKAILINGGLDISDQEAIKQMVSGGYISAEMANYVTIIRASSVKNTYVNKDDNVVIYKDSRPYVAVLLGIFKNGTDEVYYGIKADCGNIIGFYVAPQPVPPTPEAIDFKFVKKWVGGSDNSIPGSIQVSLWKQTNAGAQKVTTMTLSNNGTRIWAGQFNNLPVPQNGEHYFVREESALQNWNVDYPDSHTIINSYRDHKAKTVSLIVVKKWSNDTPGKRPQSITVDLYRNGQAISTVTLSAANNWTAEFNGLKAGYRYSVAERYVANYSPSYTTETWTAGDIEYKKIYITNSYVPPVVPPKNGGKSPFLKDYGAVQDANKAPTTKPTTPAHYTPAQGESNILDSNTAPAPNLDAKGAATDPVLDSDGATTTVVVDSVTNSNQTNNVANESVPVNVNGTIVDGSNNVNVTEIPNATLNVGTPENPINTPVSGDD